MNAQEKLNFRRIAEAIHYLKGNFQEQPPLEEIAERANLSPFHFQRLFTEWAGVSPKKFLQFLTIDHAKKILQDSKSTLFDAAFESGLSGTGRLHDLFIKVEGMTPGEFKNGGETLSINFDFADTPFGKVLVASTPKGICYLSFVKQNDDSSEYLDSQALSNLKNHFPKAQYFPGQDDIQRSALRMFEGSPDGNDIRLHLRGTEFQLKVWEALLRIPAGGLASYGAIANHLNQPRASRAVGTAVGDNPVAFLIPCHRVIQSSGVLGEYHWGSDRKIAMIGWEAAKFADAYSK